MKNIDQASDVSALSSDVDDVQTSVIVEKIKQVRPYRILTRDEIIEVGALAAYLSKEQVADYFNISRDGWYDLEKRQPEIILQYKNGKAKSIQNVAKGLIRQAHDGNTAAAIFYLKTQAGWKETQVIENTHKFNKNLDDFYTNDDDLKTIK